MKQNFQQSRSTQSSDYTAYPVVIRSAMKNGTQIIADQGISQDPAWSNRDACPTLEEFSNVQKEEIEI